MGRAMITGLTDDEARARRARGEGNDFEVGASRGYFDIARANLFNFFNNLLFVIGVALIALGRFYDAMTSVGLALVNAVISTVQELHAKRQLDRIALLTRPTVTLVRSGGERTADPTEIVKGDILRLRSGDQVVVDGTVVGDGLMEIDESLLTGESAVVRKREGEALLSGSFCVSGDGHYRADKVGRDSYANQLTASARQFVLVKTPLQKQIDFSVRVIMLVVAIMSGVILLAAVLESVTTLRLVQLAAVLSGQVPYGLFFVIIVAYAMGAAAISRQGALIQQINAVESLSDVDVLCTDKTGTLTANRLAVRELEPVAALDKSQLAGMVGQFAHGAADDGSTVVALRAATPGSPATVAVEVPFSSARKWSALAFSDGAYPGTYVLGAFEALAPGLAASDAAVARLEERVAALAAEGLRVLLFARNDDVDALRASGDTPQLPALEPLGLIVMNDELRPHAAATLAAFARLGIRVKIISGDDPRTVVAVARQAGVTGDLPMMTGGDLDGLADEAFDQAAEDAAIFGRISPAQKERLVSALIRRGHHVAMLGDGVNDVLALKKAQLGIAMQSGSPAARGIADIVLTGDSFAALMPAFHEGQRIVGGMTTVMALFLARVSASILMIIAITMLGLSFPFEPAQVATSLFTVGIPALLLAVWAKPATQAGDLLPRLVRFVIPSAIVTMIVGVALYTYQYNRVLNSVTDIDIPERVIEMFERVTGIDHSSADLFAGAAATIVAQTTLSFFIAYTAFALILFVEPPVRFFTGWQKTVSDDRRPAYLAIALSVVFFGVVQTGPIAAYFGLIPLAPGMLLQVAAGLVIWTFALREIWRRDWFDRFLGSHS